MEFTVTCADEAAMVALGNRLGAAATTGGVIYFDGILGAGKTTLCRGVLRAFGHQGAVKSPTYTLVEPYLLGRQQIYHFDLYRLGNPEELEYMGIRDYFVEGNLCLIEWPNRGAGFLPPADLIVKVTLSNDEKGNGRTVQLQSHSPLGEDMLRRLCP